MDLPNIPGMMRLCYPRSPLGPSAQPPSLTHRFPGGTENFNGQFKGVFDLQRQVPTKGEANTRRYILGAVLVYQRILWYRFEHGLDLRVGLESFLKAA